MTSIHPAMSIAFFVPCVPVAQPRQRHAMIAGHIRNYVPAAHPVVAFKASCRAAFAAVYQGAPLAGPLALTIRAVFPRPRAMCWKKRQQLRVPMAKKPDADNIAKSVTDALNQLAYGDDSQIACLVVEKWIAAGYEQPHVYVLIEQIPSEGEP